MKNINNQKNIFDLLIFQVYQKAEEFSPASLPTEVAKKSLPFLVMTTIYLVDIIDYFLDLQNRFCCIHAISVNSAKIQRDRFWYLIATDNGNRHPANFTAYPVGHPHPPYPISIIFVLADFPPTILKELFETSKCFANTFINISLA